MTKRRVPFSRADAEAQFALNATDAMIATGAKTTAEHLAWCRENNVNPADHAGNRRTSSSKSASSNEGEDQHGR